MQNQNITDSLKGKTLVLTGGTGSFSNSVLKHFITSDLAEIRIFSRDEKKQDTMRHILQARYPEHCGKVKFFIGDVRNLESVRDVMHKADFVFHSAALKEVPSCEFFPIEAVKTNILGIMGGCPPSHPHDTLQVEIGDYDKLLDFCSVPRSRIEMMDFMELTNRRHFWAHYLKPLLESERLLMTIPDKPSSPKQKYQKR